MMVVYGNDEISIVFNLRLSFLKCHFENSLNAPSIRCNESWSESSLSLPMGSSTWTMRESRTRYSPWSISLCPVVSLSSLTCLTMILNLLRLNRPWRGRFARNVTFLVSLYLKSYSLNVVLPTHRKDSPSLTSTRL